MHVLCKANRCVSFPVLRGMETRSCRGDVVKKTVTEASEGKPFLFEPRVTHALEVVRCLVFISSLCAASLRGTTSDPENGSSRMEDRRRGLSSHLASDNDGTPTTFRAVAQAQRVSRQAATVSAQTRTPRCPAPAGSRPSPSTRAPTPEEVSASASARVTRLQKALEAFGQEDSEEGQGPLEEQVEASPKYLERAQKRLETASADFIRALGHRDQMQ